MKVPPKRKGNALPYRDPRKRTDASMKVPPKRKGNPRPKNPDQPCSPSLNESPSEKEGKSGGGGGMFKIHLSASMKVPPKRKGNRHLTRPKRPGQTASMKVPPKRKGNSYPKIARNHAAETGASREPRGGYTQNYTLQPHLPPHNSLAREETMRATRHVPVTYQVLAHTKTPAGCFLSDPARVFTYERGWRGSGKPD